MKAVTLRTGVKITFDKKGNIKKCVSPYDSDKPTLKTILRTYVQDIKDIINPKKQSFYDSSTEWWNGEI